MGASPSLPEVVAFAAAAIDASLPWCCIMIGFEAEEGECGYGCCWAELWWRSLTAVVAAAAGPKVCMADPDKPMRAGEA